MIKLLQSIICLHTNSNALLSIAMDHDLLHFALIEYWNFGVVH